MPTIERNLTDMLRSSGDVLREAELQDVVLRRRDGADMMLVDLEREQGVRQSLASAARMIGGLANAPSPVFEGIAEMLPDAIAWTRFLPIDDRVEFVREFAQTAAACVDADVFEPLTRLNREWLATAAVHADPDLAGVLLEPGAEDLGPVERPAA